MYVCISSSICKVQLQKYYNQKRANLENIKVQYKTGTQEDLKVLSRAPWHMSIKSVIYIILHLARFLQDTRNQK